MVLQDVDLGIAHAVQSHGAQRQLLQVTVNTRLDSSANHRSYVLDVPLHFLPHVCELQPIGRGGTRRFALKR